MDSLVEVGALFGNFIVIIIITVFTRLNAAAFINFSTYFGAAFIRGRRLFLWATQMVYIIFFYYTS